MSGSKSVLDILVVDDDQQVIDQLKLLLPNEIGEFEVAWDFSNDFSKALSLLQRRRYDVLVSDIYRARGTGQKNVEQGDIKAKELVDQIRQHRFCPIVLFTDGQVPTELVERPFVWSTDKAAGDFEKKLSSNIGEAIDSGLPAIARKLHDELDRYAGSYVWQFLAKRWDELRREKKLDNDALERIIRRRAAVQLGRTDWSGEEVVELANSEPADLYLYPPIGEAMRLGEIIRRKGTGEFRVVLTPHCFLLKQPDQQQPRAAYILTALTVPASEIAAKWKWSNNDAEASDDLRRRVGFPASKCPPPDGRYCFLPGFLDIPDLYCDLLQLESLGYETVGGDFDRIAVLDQPYAEALQSCVNRLYGSVGVPVLNRERVKHLLPDKK